MYDLLGMFRRCFAQAQNMFRTTLNEVLCTLTKHVSHTCERDVWRTRSKIPQEALMVCFAQAPVAVHPTELYHTAQVLFCTSRLRVCSRSKNVLLTVVVVFSTCASHRCFAHRL